MVFIWRGAESAVTEIVRSLVWPEVVSSAMIVRTVERSPELASSSRRVSVRVLSAPLPPRMADPMIDVSWPAATETSTWSRELSLSLTWSATTTTEATLPTCVSIGA